MNIYSEKFHFSFKFCSHLEPFHYIEWHYFWDYLILLKHYSNQLGKYNKNIFPRFNLQDETKMVLIKLVNIYIKAGF